MHHAFYTSKKTVYGVQAPCKHKEIKEKLARTTKITQHTYVVWSTLKTLEITEKHCIN